MRSGREFCTPHAIPYSILEEIILNDFNTIIRNVNNLTELLKQNQAQENFLKRQNDNEKNRLKAELEKTGALRKAVYEDYREGLISKDEFVTYREDYVKKEELFTKQLEDMESRQKNRTADQLMENPWVKRLLTLRGIDRLDRDIVVEMVHEIRVYENHRIQIIYNFSDELAHLFSGTRESTGQKEVI